MSNENTPDVRFCGFEDDWEERKLGGCAEFFDEKRVPIDASKRNIGKYPYYGATGIIDYTDGYIFDGEYVLLAEDGANIITRNNPVAYLTCGKFWLNNHAHIMKSINGSNHFLVQLLEKHCYEKYNSGTAQPKLNGQIIKNMIFILPERDEQTKIGNFFKQLDDKITIHQNELEYLKQTKQGFLQKMFPKDGELVPEVWFAGFCEDWEQRKLGEVKDVRDGTHDSPKYHSEGYPLITSKNLTENGLDYSDVSLISETDFCNINKRSKVDVGDIIFGMIGTIGNPVISDRDNFAIKNVALIKTDGAIINEFLIQHLKSNIFSMYICNENVGNTQKFIGLSKIRNYLLLVPIHDEQTKIGNFFKALDDLITLHQSELNSLKLAKKAFLQKMFI